MGANVISVSSTPGGENTKDDVARLNADGVWVESVDVDGVVGEIPTLL